MVKRQAYKSNFNKMNIQLPIDGTYERYPKGNLTQGYKENVDLYLKELGMYGHNGGDLVKFYGADILAPHDGTVIFKDFQEKGYGHRIDIISEEENGRCLVSTLGHMIDTNLVSVGQKVKAGDVVAKMGNSGFVVSGGVIYWGGANPDKKGTHVHWTPKWVHKAKPGEQGASVTYLGVPYIVENYNNGVFGAVDPKTLLEGETMTNAYLVKNGSEFAGALPLTAEAALMSFLLNVGVEPPKKPDGSLDFDKLSSVIKVITL